MERQANSFDFEALLLIVAAESSSADMTVVEVADCVVCMLMLFEV